MKMQDIMKMKNKGLIFDLDGVIYRGKTPIPGVVKTLNSLFSQYNILFLTNNATKSRSAFVGKLQNMGINCEKNHILNSGYATALYCSLNNINTVYLVGEQGLYDEFSLQGINVSDHNVDAVVCALDRFVTYEKLSIALQEINSGAKYIATNLDATLPIENGFLPGSGSLNAAITCASGVKPKVIGKPHQPIMDIALEMLGLSPENIVVIGDRYDTDIASGKLVDAKTVAVYTGAIRKEDPIPKEYTPDVFIDSVAQLKSVLPTLFD